MKDHNRIISVKTPSAKNNRYILIIHYRHAKRPDEFFYLTKEQIARHHLAQSVWGNLSFNKAEREIYAHQTIASLAEGINQNTL